MKIKFFKNDFSISKLRDLGKLNMSSDLFFFAKTADELSLVCPSGEVPENAITVDGGWRMFRVEGQLDFALVGILSKLTQILAARNISVFAISTYDTDYVLVKEGKLEETREVLRENGYEVV